uniref:Uncharacterized protein n=1 Tax=Timema genevievae TaxID=629358 RepID=A0A7R9K0J8_TIMGE|nr:unnamed protein product [Timema genevievae]
MAVIKNRWLANRLGGDMFSVICKVHQSPSLAEEGKTQAGLWLEKWTRMTFLLRGRNITGNESKYRVRMGNRIF